MASVSGVQPRLSGRFAVAVPERGHIDLPSALWGHIRAEAGFWALVDQSMVEVSQLSGGRTRLRGSCYVGRVAFKSGTLDLIEKIPGATASLLQSASADSFRIEHLPSSASDLGALACLLVRQFLHVTRRYVTAGREFEYREVPGASSIVCGRLNTTQSLKLRARGLRHLLAFRRTTIRKDTPKNKMVAAALRQIGGLARLVSLPQEDLFIARALSLMFSDCYDRELLFGSRETLVREAVRLAASTQAGKERDLLYLASVVLSHESFEYGAQSTHTVPRAWFLNLENLFQVAVQRFLQENYEGKVRTAAQVGMGMPIFPEVPNAYRANPDLVFLNNGVVEAVGDVKYKIWTGAPAPSDLYQLLSHAAALGAKRSFLVFPGDQFQEKQLGVSVTGCRTWLFAIDVRDMKAQMSLLMARLGFQTDGG